MSSGILLTVGYGTRSLADLGQQLRIHQIEYVIDVRSIPYARYNTPFSQPHIGPNLQKQGFRYLDFGAQLGGKVTHPELGTRLNPAQIAQSAAFQQGIQRLLHAYQQGFRLCLLCSEHKPEQCHRSHLIGEALAQQQQQLWHLDEHYLQCSQSEIMARRLPQPTLFDPFFIR